jgi:hypothetical protein
MREEELVMRAQWGMPLTMRLRLKDVDSAEYGVIVSSTLWGDAFNLPASFSPLFGADSKYVLRCRLVELC